jgi:ribonuclease M5
LIKVSKPIIVEGKYDKITLENVVDALIIPTDGFGIFKNKEKCGMIRSLAEKNGGIIVMTDSDSAGSVIRGYLKKIIGDTPIINVYVPCLKGKEKRKANAGKEGLLGVEGMTPEIIIEALHRSGVNSETTVEKKEKITKTYFFEAGLSGCADSSLNRKKLLRFLNLPENLSPNAMLDILNNIMDLKEFKEVTARCLKEEVKS